MIKEIKYLVFIIIIFSFVYFTVKFYFSDVNKKKSYRSLNEINDKIILYTKNLPVLKNNTNNVTEYTEEVKTQKKKKYLFWKLINKDE